MPLARNFGSAELDVEPEGTNMKVITRPRAYGDDNISIEDFVQSQNEATFQHEDRSIPSISMPNKSLDTTYVYLQGMSIINTFFSSSLIV